LPLTLLEHPVAADRVAQLRDAAIETQQFRALLEDVSIFLAVEATRTLPTKATPITTPVASCVGRRLTGKPIIAPIMRAGLGLLPGFQRMLPNATIAHLGFFRNPATLEAVPYYANLPDSLVGREIFVLDPMLATGHSASAALTLLEAHGAVALTFVSLVASKSGIDALQARFPTLHIVTAAIDEQLNDHGYIVPGLGDAGDRLFGTDHSVPISGL
jgi:uracil phosphoribosyltransferase